jgi:hypothetical protein
MRRWLLLTTVFGCTRGEPAIDEATRRAAASSDSSFAAVQSRGAVAMGVDQYSSTHHFTPLPEGGLIELQRDSVDPAGIAVIRDHMRQIAAAFAAGDFTLPGMVHAQEVPGTTEMSARRAAITYVAEELPRGGQVRITTTDSSALKAIHAFLAFQRSDHHAGMRHDN